MRIRSASEADWVAVREIQEGLVFTATGYSFSQFSEGTPGLISQGSNDARQFVAIDDKDGQGVLGFAEFDAETAQILGIGVPPRYQGRRFGRELVRECLLRARAAKCHAIQVGCTLAVSEFFEGLGFERKQESVIEMPDGNHIPQVVMSRPVEHPYILERIPDIEASVRFFGSGQAQQQAQERYVVQAFLRGLGIEFSDNEIVIPSQDPPDALFRGANFEVKELYPPKRRRHDEYKQQLEKAKKAFWPDELFTGYTPEDIMLTDVIAQVAELGERYVDRYEPAKRAGLDLLVYVNLQHVESIIPTPLPDLTALRTQGWRSVSFLRGVATSCVLVAEETAPEFVRRARGLLLKAGEEVGRE